MNRFVRLFCLLVLPVSSLAQTVLNPPDLTGYITRIASPIDFDVAGTHVIINNETLYRVPDSKLNLATRTPLPLFLGENVDIFGKRDHKHHTVVAETIITHPVNPLPVSGAGIIDLLMPASATSGDRIVRADGYLLHVRPDTALTFVPPLVAGTSLSTNLWINYHGIQQADGTVLLDRAELRANEIKPAEAELRSESEYDPAAVPPDAKQGYFSKGTFGVDPHLIPPYTKFPLLQQRAVRIGNSIVPAFQRQLTDADPTKIHFRFQLVDQPRWHDALTLPSGVILVPFQLVDRLANDSQLAAVLADNIAVALEKQTMRATPTDTAIKAAQLLGTAGGFVVPGLDLATGIATGSADAHLLLQEQQQSGRVSLCLLHDAGYDLREAPIAWWLLAPSRPTAITSVSLPSRAAYLYLALGTTWRQTLSSSSTPTGAPIATPASTP